jgi:predicted Zn-dependent peptidase
LLKGELADVLAENDYYEENYIYRELVKTFFNRPNATICPQEELVNFTYDHLVEFYRQTINFQNLTLINHGDMSHEYILSLWNEFSSNQ